MAASIWQRLSKLVTPSPQVTDDAFSLYEATRQERKDDGEEGGGGKGRGTSQDDPQSDRTGQDQGGDGEKASDHGGASRFVQPRQAGERRGERKRAGAGADATDDADKDGLDAYRTDDPNKVPDPIDRSLDLNLKRLKTVFRIPQNKDLVLREFIISRDTPVKGAILFIDGMAAKEIIDWAVLQPLMLLADLPPMEADRDPQLGQQPDILEAAYNHLVPINQVSKTDRLPDLVKGVLAGGTAIVLDGTDRALVVETKGWEHRSVGEPKQEAVIRGPHEAFNETMRTNTAMIRRRLKTPALMTEFMEIGRLSNVEVAMMYIDGLTNTALVDEVRTRLKAIKVDYVSDSGTIEQFIEDSPFSLYPSILSTERPDRTAAFLSEGHVVLIVNNNPFALVVPITLVGLMHTAEDAYLRWPFGSFLRILRTVSYFVALSLPALYVAATAYHHETIPTDLAMAIAASREAVPFPVVVEVLLLAFSFELITEAATRVPSIIGPTIGIVGALVLGQAAVQAGIVSPILVIVIAMTALAAFTVPNYNLSNTLRVLRYVHLLAGSVLGFYGIAVVFFVDVARLSVQRSFGVPMLNPITPMKGGQGDVILRGPVFHMEKRPRYTYPQELNRQPPIVRKWDRTQGSGPSKGKEGGG